MSLNKEYSTNVVLRINFWYSLILILGSIFIIRLFYLQVIKHDYYQKTANFSQLKQYEIPAKRGVIEAKSGDTTIPLVLNESLYTVFADPKFVKDPSDAANKIAQVTGGNKSEYEASIREPNSPRYTILAKRLDKNTAKKINELKLKGVGTREVQYRTYPDAQLASQVLGFVNEDGEGKYGLEQALNKQLSGSPGKLKAITDAKGVPLAANKDNLVVEPKAGDKVTLTIDIGLQQQLEEILKQGVEKSRSKSGSAFIMDVDGGAVRAMAGYPTFSPAEFYKTKNAELFNNTNVSSPLEVGSIMKPFTAAAAMNQGVVNKNTSYYDPSFYKIDGAKVTNIEEDGGAATRTVSDILKYSLNTGATWLLMQMGGGEINKQARTVWHDYMVNKFFLGRPTGIEQGYEAEGFIPSPTEGWGLNITYANSSFGQGMTATPIQMGAAFSSIINGGKYYKPTLVESVTDSTGKKEPNKPDVLKDNVVSHDVSEQLNSMLITTFEHNRAVYGMRKTRTAYSIGGKTGTAQITKPTGGYYDDKFNGMYLGFVGGDKPQYVIVVRMDEPNIAGYAGSRAAAPVFVDLANMLIDSYGVTPKSN